MDLEAIVDDELVQPLRGAIVAENMIATRQLIESVHTTSNITANKQEVKLFAESYILELRDGEQYKSPPTLEDITIWVDAKGLNGILDPASVLGTILSEGTTWDQRGGSSRLQEVLSPENIQRVMDIAVAEVSNDLIHNQWQLR